MGVLRSAEVRRVLLGSAWVCLGLLRPAESPEVCLGLQGSFEVCRSLMKSD